MKYTLFFLLFAVLMGCAPVVNVEQPTNALIRDGNTMIAEGEYEAAIELFEAAVYNAENPEQAQVAQKLLGDAYYGEKKFPEAVASYEVYYDIYQDDPKISEVVYKLGMSYAKIKYKGGRDTAYTRKALDYFDELKDFYPNEYLSYNAQPERQKMMDRLADYEYQVARFYVRTKRPESAAGRLLYLINNYPESTIVPNAMAMLVETSMTIPGREEMVPMYMQELQENYPDYEGLSELERKVRER
jgi:outer membrane protein assembly factor BamD